MTRLELIKKIETKKAKQKTIKKKIFGFFEISILIYLLFFQFKLQFFYLFF